MAVIFVRKIKEGTIWQRQNIPNLKMVSGTLMCGTERIQLQEPRKERSYPHKNQVVTLRKRFLSLTVH